MRSVLCAKNIEEAGALRNAKQIIELSGNVSFNIPHCALPLIW